MVPPRDGADVRQGAEPLVMFVAGVPTIDDAMPGAGHHVIAVAALGPAFGGVDGWGGAEPGDALPGQVFGEQGRCGRMVLDIARRVGLRVKVVDVNRPGADADLVQRLIRPDDDLPVLIRPDGARLSGEGSFVPKTVERFLVGPR
jgi:hypothetical protein